MPVRPTPSSSVRRRARIAARALPLLLAAALPLQAAQAADVQFKPTGVAMYDLVDFDGARGDASVDRVRSARIGFKLGDKDRWMLNVEHELTDRSTPDLFLQLQLARGHSLRLGQFKQSFGLEDATSARQTPLMENSLSSVFAISRRIGAGYTWAGERNSLNASVFGKRLDGKNEGSGAAVRGTRVLARWDDGLVHVGASAALDRPDNERARFAAKSETAFAPYSTIDSGVVAGASRVARYGGEFLALSGPWSLQAEAAQVHVSAAGADFDGHGGYAMLGYSPSGHARSYKAGTVGAPALAGGPAWELFLRHSRLDLDDGPRAGGRQHDWALGATVHLNAHVRVMANVIAADVRRGGASEHPRIAQLRMQLAF